MDELSVTRVESGFLIVTNSDGVEFTVAVDEVTLNRLKRSMTPIDAHQRVSPRDIQAHLRAGLSRDEVAALTGLTSGDIERFEGPVLAELEYVVNAALALPAPQTENGSDSKTTTIGVRVHTQIERLGGSAPTWSSWRNAQGDWHLTCMYSVHDREIEARWTFDPKHHLLTPLDDEAAHLMSVEVYSSGVIPRLRAVKPQRKKATSPVARVDTPDGPPEDAPSASSAHDNSGAIKDDGDTQTIDTHAGDPVAVTETPGAGTRQESFEIDGLGDSEPSPTADLLEALRKRRSENANAPAWLAEAAAETSSVQPSITDEIKELHDNPPPKPSRGSGSRRHRAEMPTWDEIVFGTKVEDDLL